MKHAMWCLSALGIATLAVAAPPTYRESDFARVEKVDLHMHLRGDLPGFVARAKTDNFRVLTINVNYGDFPPLDRQLRDAVALHTAYPSVIAFAATFDAKGSESPEWLPRTQRKLDEALAQGAVAVKVWKDIGMQWRDADGRAVMIDDARFTPIFAKLADRGVCVLGHQGEPRNAWLPLDQMTINGDRQYFTEHPQYHMFAHPEWPSYEEQIAARDRWLEHNPRLCFVGVHLASLEWDVARIGEFLRKHPTASVDLSARLVHLELQSVTGREKVRAFFIEFQDRILYGTDLANGEQPDAAFADEAHAAWSADWRFLAGNAELKSTDFDGAYRGLALPRAVIDKIYGGNAFRIFPKAWPARR